MFWHIMTGPSTLLMNKSAMAASGGISFTPEMRITGNDGHLVLT